MIKCKMNVMPIPILCEFKTKQAVITGSISFFSLAKKKKKHLLRFVCTVNANKFKFVIRFQRIVANTVHIPVGCPERQQPIIYLNQFGTYHEFIYEC